MEAEGREGRGGDQRKEMRRRVIRGVLDSTLYRKFETYFPRNETARPCSQYLHSCIWERFIYSHDRSYLESLFFFIVWEKSQLNHRSREKGRELPPSTGWLQSLPSPPFLGWAESSHKWPTYKFPLWKITDHKWKQLILVSQFRIWWFESEWDFKEDIYTGFSPALHLQCNNRTDMWPDRYLSEFATARHDFAASSVKKTRNTVSIRKFPTLSLRCFSTIVE
jgi:hypothetical protein